MKAKFILMNVLNWLVMIFTTVNLAGQEIEKLGASVSRVIGSELIVQKRQPNGELDAAKPYIIKGVCWSPSSKTTNTSKTDSKNVEKRRPEYLKWYKTDVKLLKNMNLNTVRLFFDTGIDSNSIKVLNEFYINDIMVIMTIDDGINDLERIKKVTSVLKDHPAILFWSLGNEWNINNYYNPAKFPTILSAAQATQNAAALVKSIDSNHLVSTSYGDIDIDFPNGGGRLTDLQNYMNNVCSDVDIWGFNIYRGHSLGMVPSTIKSISKKPIYFSELGIDSWNNTTGKVDEISQASWNMRLWDEIFLNLSGLNIEGNTIGATFFEFSDEHWKVSPYNTQDLGGWKAPFPDGFANEEWFGLVTIDRRTKTTYDSLKIAFSNDYNPRARFRKFNFQSQGKYQYSRYPFTKDGAVFHSTWRGFNICAIDQKTGEQVTQAKQFDTWGNGENEIPELLKYIENLPDGTDIIVAAHDELGLNNGYGCVGCKSCCTFINSQLVQDCLTTFKKLGSDSLSKYCYWNSWLFHARKGSGKAIFESMKCPDLISYSFDLLVTPDYYSSRYPESPVILNALIDTVCNNSKPTNIQWLKQDGISNYKVQIASDPRFLNVIEEINTSQNALTFSRLFQSGKSYYFRVKAANTAGESRWSVSRKFTIENATITKDLHDTFSSELMIIPNPNDGRFNLKFIPNGPYEVNIYNSLGQLLFNKENSDMFCDLQFLNSGFYYVTVTNNNQRYSAKLIIKQ